MAASKESWFSSLVGGCEERRWEEEEENNGEEEDDDDESHSLQNDIIQAPLLIQLST